MLFLSHHCWWVQGLFIFCEFECVLLFFFFASNIDDMKSTINRMVGVQLLSHACQNCVSTSLLLGIRKHL